MNQMVSPFRCETCKKGYCFNRAVPEHIYFTEIRGCASHSDFQNRDKVLDEMVAEISKRMGIPIDELKKMDIHEIEERLSLHDCDPRSSTGLYKFVSRNEYARRTKVVEAELRQGKDGE